MPYISIRKKVLAAAAAAGTAALLLTSCAPADDTASDGPEPYNLGISAELSGGVAAYGTTIRDGIRAWADQVNLAGGIAGHPVELTILDTAGDASRAATNATQLATTEGMSGILGMTLSSGCTAATPIAERYKVPIACLSIAEPNDYVFQLGPNAPTGAIGSLQASVKISGVDEPNIALAYLNTATSTEWGNRVNTNAAAEGATIVANVQYDIASTDLSGTWSQLLASNPDVITVSGTSSNIISLLKAIRAAGSTVPVFWVDGTGNLKAVEGVDDPSLYGFTSYLLPDLDNLTGIAAEFVDATGPYLPSVSDVNLATGEYAMGYLTATAWGRALEECGYPCSGEQLQAVLTDFKTDLTPMVEGFDYNNALHFPFLTFYMYKINKDGVYEFVESYEAILP